jgi:hypothetical protein
MIKKYMKKMFNILVIGEFCVNSTMKYYLRPNSIATIKKKKITGGKTEEKKTE